MNRSMPILISLILSAGSVARSQWSQLPGKGSHWCLASYMTDDTIIAATQDSNVLRSTDQGLTWMQSSQGIQDSIYANVLFGEGSNVYLGSNKGSYRSTDAGRSWHKIDAGPSGPQFVYSFYRSGLYLFMGGDSGVFRSSDNGQNWQAANSGIPAQTLVRSFASDDIFLYTGTSHQGIFRSSDEGEHWELRSTPEFKYDVVRTLWAGDGYILAFDRAGTWFRSTDRGVTWESKNINLTSGADQTFCAFQYQHSIICGSNDGVIRSDDYGATWRYVGDNLPAFCRAFSVTVSDSFIYAGTVDYWVWRCPLSEIFPPSGVDASIAPYALRLSQNTPNPAASTAEIPYALPAYTSVNLKLYNAMMQEVSTLVDEPQEAGEHHATLNASALPSGIYYYRLSTGTSSLTRRMLIVK